jgi:hypothetical protein
MGARRVKRPMQLFARYRRSPSCNQIGIGRLSRPGFEFPARLACRAPYSPKHHRESICGLPMAAVAAPFGNRHQIDISIAIEEDST